MSREITVDEFNALNADEYVLYDLRGETERSYGAIPCSVPLSPNDALALNGRSSEDGKKIILYCSRGIKSAEVVAELEENGVEAYGLKGGYIAWLMRETEKLADAELCEKVEKDLRKKFKSKLLANFLKAIKEYDLVKDGDKIAVCISGGKDSMLMAKLFQEVKRHGKFNFELRFVVMDPGYNKENRRLIEHNAKILNIPITVFESNIFEAVYRVEKSPCYLCARMRRGYLYNFAKGLGCNKIALGHHYDDVIETILMGMLYAGQIQTMMPKLKSENFEGMELIRPMYFIREDDIKAWRDYNGLHFIQCACKFTDECATCSDEQNPSKRIETKKLIREMKKTNPMVEKCLFKSVENVNLNAVIAYKKDDVVHRFSDDY